MQNTKKHKNEKETLSVNTLVLIVLVKMSVLIPAFFILGVFGISKCLRDVFDR